MAESRFASSNRPAGEKTPPSVQPGGARHEALEARGAAARAKADLLSRRPAGPQPIQRAPAAPPNRTGLPDGLKAGIESLSGVSLDDVRVHYDSSRPVALQAHAFAQGPEIHLAPGQRRHLPHEAWHVVQQKQGRVGATGRTAGGIAVNDSPGLEAEADRMGARASRSAAAPLPSAAFATRDSRPGAEVLQAVWKQEGDRLYWEPPVSGVVWQSDGNLYWFEIVGKAGKPFEAMAGEQRTYEEWKAMGAGEAVEPDIVPKPDTDEIILRLAKKNPYKNETLKCHFFATEFERELNLAQIHFNAVKFTIRRGKKDLVQNAVGAQITLHGEPIGVDQHFFTVVKFAGQEMVFDNMSPKGIPRAEHFARLKFFLQAENEALTEVTFSKDVIVLELEDSQSFDEQGRPPPKKYKPGRKAPRAAAAKASAPRAAASKAGPSSSKEAKED